MIQDAEMPPDRAWLIKKLTWFRDLFYILGQPADLTHLTTDKIQGIINSGFKEAEAYVLLLQTEDVEVIYQVSKLDKMFNLNSGPEKAA